MDRFGRSMVLPYVCDPALAARLTMKGQNMTQLKSSQSEHASVGRATIGRLFVLEASGNRVLSLNPDGSDRKVIVTDCRIPDGIAVDVEGRQIYWTNAVLSDIRPRRSASGGRFADGRPTHCRRDSTSR